MRLVRTPQKIVIHDLGVGYRDLEISIRPFSDGANRPVLFLGEDRIAILHPRAPFTEMTDADVAEQVERAMPALQRDIQSRLDADARRDGMISAAADRSLARSRDDDIVAIESVGIAMFGAGRWQAPLAKELGWSQALLARIVSGERTLTDEKRQEWRYALASVIRPRAAEMLATIDRAMNRMVAKAG